MPDQAEPVQPRPGPVPPAPAQARTTKTEYRVVARHSSGRNHRWAKKNLAAAEKSVAELEELAATGAVKYWANAEWWIETREVTKWTRTDG